MFCLLIDEKGGKVCIYVCWVWLVCDEKLQRMQFPISTLSLVPP